MSDTPAPATAPSSEPQLVWDDSRMTTHFANVVNIQSTMEQVDLFFGTNQTWNTAQPGKVVIDLTHRVILGPHAAKRLSLALSGVIRQYEERYGTLKVGD